MNHSSKNQTLVETDLIMSHEFTIDRPAKEVWPHMINLGGWMPTHKLVTVEGNSGEVGETIKVYSSEKAYFHLKTIKMEPCKSVVMKMMPLDDNECALIENDADLFKNVLGIESYRLVEFDGATKLMFQGVGLFKSSERTQAELDTWVASATEGAKDRWKTIYEPGLRNLVAGIN